MAKILLGESDSNTNSDNKTNTTSKPQPEVNTSIIDISECEALLKKNIIYPKKKN